MSAPIADRTLWDTLGNKCRVEMHCIGRNVFEVYFHDFNSDIPTRYTGAIGDCNARVDRWLERKARAGFAEQLPSCNQRGKHKLTLPRPSPTNRLAGVVTRLRGRGGDLIKKAKYENHKPGTNQAPDHPNTLLSERPRRNDPSDGMVLALQEMRQNMQPTLTPSTRGRGPIEKENKMKRNQNIGGSILPSSCPEILTVLNCKVGQLQVKPVPERDTHSLALTTESGSEIVASHPNGYSCRSLAERIVSGDARRIRDQADYIVRCAGTVNQSLLEKLIT